MLSYLVRRVYQGVIVLWGVTLVTFGLSRLDNVNYGRVILGVRATAGQMRAFNHKYGFDQSTIVQYWRYIWRLLHGNLGVSFSRDNPFAPVTQIIGPALQATLWLVFTSIIVSVVIAVPLGMIQALRRNTKFDYAATTVIFIIYSTPAFLLGVMLVIIFATHWHIFPTAVVGTGRTGPFARLLDIVTNPRSYVLPVAVLVGLSVGGYSRFMRGSVLDVLVQDYVRTARAKGASSARVLFRHAMRNAIIPIITILGLTLPALFAGAVITESIFNLEGIGTVTVQAVKGSDVNTVMATTLLIALSTVFGNFLADVGVSLVDPRVRLTGKR